MMYLKCILTFTILVGIHCSSQTLKTIENMQIEYQSCLDTGNAMHLCSTDYYEKSDSLLNVVYNKLRKKYNPAQKRNLKKEQINWLAKRDLYFKKEYTSLKNNKNFEEGTHDFEMVLYHNKSKFVIDRVKVLVKKL